MDPIIKEGQNTGVQEVAIKEGDWIAGAETGITGQITNPSGDWTSYLPAGEWQKLMQTNFETDACVSFSDVQPYATYLDFLIATKQVSADALAFLNSNGYIVDGCVSFSPRFTAKVSGTTTNGNSLPVVAQASRTFGFVPDADWPWPVDAINASPDNAWAIYYADVPQSVLDKGKAFLAHFTPQYDWVIPPGGAQDAQASIKQALTVSPLQIATAVCWPWNQSAPINGCGPGAAHGTELYKVNDDGTYAIFDHYVPFNKTLAANYNITYAMRLVLTPVATVPVTFPAPVGFKYDFQYQLDFGATGPDVVALQNALKADGEFSIAVQSTGVFGSITQVALKAFQVKHGISPVGRVGPQTLAMLNSLYNK
jgi:hypothetical protein